MCLDSIVVVMCVGLVDPKVVLMLFIFHFDVLIAFYFFIILV